MKHTTTVVLITTSLLIFSCNNTPVDQKDAKEIAIQRKIPLPGNDNTPDYKPNLEADSIAGPQIPGEKQGKKKQQPPGNDVMKQDWDKKIVKTASINLEVKDYNSFYTSLREKVKNLGGYVAQEEQTQSDYKIENSMTIKVPVDQFDNAVVQFTGTALKINERKISSQDVTTEIVDTKSRMEAKKQVRQRYMDLLNQAKNMNDILNVQSEINGIQEEIEAAAGRIEYLGHSSVFSTINLSYYQILNSAAKENLEAKKPSFGDKLKEAFRTGWEIVSDLFIVIVTIWPLLLASFFVIILLKKLKNSRTGKV